MSGFITNETFRNLTEATADSVKTSIQRLIGKNLIRREKGQRGQGGFSSFIIDENVREAVLKEKRNSSISKPLVNGLVNAISKPLVNNKETDKGTSSSSSSSSLNNKETTTSLPEEWKFDLSPYWRIPFTVSQIKQLVPLGVISAAEVKQALEEFEYDRRHGKLPKIQTTELNYLMGLFRKGVSYVSEIYQTEVNEDVNEMKMRAEKRRVKQLQVEVLTWFESLSETEKRSMENSMPTYIQLRYQQQHGLTENQVLEWITKNYLTKIIEGTPN